MSETRSSTVPYIVALVMLVLGAFVLVGAVVIFKPDYDSTPILAFVGGIITSICLSLLALMKSIETNGLVRKTQDNVGKIQEKVEEVRLSINGRLDELLKTSTFLARAEGFEEAEQEGIVRAQEVDRRRRLPRETT